MDGTAADATATGTATGGWRLTKWRALGTLAMRRLGASPDAAKLAGGRG